MIQINQTKLTAVEQTQLEDLITQISRERNASRQRAIRIIQAQLEKEEDKVDE